MNRRTSALFALAVAALLPLVACTSDSGGDTTSTDGTPSTTTPQDLDVPSGVPMPGDPRTSKVLVTVDGTPAVVEPNEVRCQIEDDDDLPVLYVATTDGGASVIEVSRGQEPSVEITLVEGGPTHEVGGDAEWVASEANVDFGTADGDPFVLFDETVVGEATVTGRLMCTDVEG